MRKRMVPNKEEPEPEQELTEEPKQPEEPKKAEEPAEPAVAEETMKEESLQHVTEAAELTKECVDRLVEENGAEKALAEVGKCRVVKLRNLAREYDGLQIAGREISKANKTTLLEELKKFPQIKEVRGRGLMIGLEFEEPIKELRSRLIYDEHVFTGASGTNVLRLLPPLCLSMEEADEFLARFKKVL